MDMYVLAAEVDGEIAVSLHRSREQAEQAVRDNYDQEPSDYTVLSGSDLLRAIENRDGIVLGISLHTVVD